MVGHSFLYVFEGRSIEVVYRTKDFMHLTGVDSHCSAEQFYKDAIRGKLQPQQIFFSARHPYDLCVRKMSQLNNLNRVIDSAIFILEDTETNTFTYKFGLTDLKLTVCLSEDTDENGKVVGDHYIARSLRVEDSFDRADGAFEVQYIFSKKNDQRKYDTIMYMDKGMTIEELSSEVQEILDDSINNQLTEN
ncbi:MAG: PBECR4 domain-containing protein [Lachnospiraceae bacterium]|nr:PBECR4 domain-containing protein [Lachnospiraceae bacterium]